MIKQKPTILLIDDDQPLLNMYALKFSLDGSCFLMIAQTPEQGLELARTGQPDLILLDLIMSKRDSLNPELNEEVGFDTLKHLKENEQTKNTPVVIFTNLDGQTRNCARRAQELGAIDYWVKARYKPSEIIDKVRKTLKERN